MDAVRRQKIGATDSDNLNSGESTASMSDVTSAPLDASLASGLLDAIALEAVTVPGELKLAGGLDHGGPGVCLVGTDSADPIRETRIGPYAVSTWIGSGHVGDVYRARRDGDYPPQFAIKLLQHTAHKETILARFQNEIHIQTALAKHPNIAALLEAGVTEDGRLYFTMNYIEGKHINKYCDDRRLDIPSRVKLFLQVCEAVHFAHQHGIIHRNLKPSNILVTEDGLPKLVDVGIAKLVQPDAANENTTASTNGSLTRTSEVVLSPEYTSPEQIQGEAVTTASDIYALGVILYQLLSGCWPYRITSPNRSDILQAICEQLPEKPSAAITSRQADRTERSECFPMCFSTAPAELAAARDTSPQQLRRALNGDLDSIVLMALRKEPRQRYASVKHLAEDLVSYLSGAPVCSHRVFTADRVSKFIQRHAIAVAGGLLSLLLLSIGAIALTRSLLIARHERDRTEKSFHQARQVVDQISAKITHERSLDQPFMRPLRTALLMDARHFYEALLSQPISNLDHGAERATAQAYIARIISQSDSSIEAIAHCRQAVRLWEKLVLNQPDNLEYQANLAQTLIDLGVMLLPLEGQGNEALHAFRQAQTIVERLISVVPESVAYRVQLSQIMLNTAKIKERQGNLDEAITSIERMLEVEAQVVADYPELLEPRVELANAHALLGDFLSQRPTELLGAIASYQKAADFHEALARHHPELVDQYYQLASALGKIGGFQEELGQLELALQYLASSDGDPQAPYWTIH